MFSFNLVVAADIFGIIAFALSGFVVGVRHKLDLLGLFIASALTALGGGVVRDAILDRTPFAFNEYYPSVTLFLTLIVAILVLLVHTFWVLNPLSVALIATFAISLRLLAYTKQWHLPKLEI